jgi:hypothetical protein
MRRLTSALGFLCLGLLALGACGGGEPAKSPDLPAEAPADDPTPAPKPEPAEEPKGDEPAENPDKGAASPEAAEPTFKEGGSVDEAINAVPQGVPRVNVEQDMLAKPLMDENLYKPCRLAPNQRLKLKVAIWDGRAVGIDVTATPKNEKVVACIKQQIAGITWKAKVRSLNTVEYQL